jgi:dTDP-4-amino-4,6-dideoxygalactose transaminase
VILPKTQPWAEPVFHLFVIQVQDRERLADYLKEKEIQTGVHYPIPNHQAPAVRQTLGPQPKLERTEEAAGKILSLPIYPDLTKQEVDGVCGAIREFFKK